VFHTASDTEVIINGYERWGGEVVTRLRGMFAFALWDERRRRFMLCRDRYGVKPMYYAEPSPGRLLFASEIKALLVDAAVSPALNEKKLAEYLAFRSIAGEETLFKGVKEVLPGTMIILEGEKRVTRTYWTPNVKLANESSNVVERGRELLVDAVKSRLVSDVELGTITSGGLDSSLVSAIAAQQVDTRIDTFCVGFDDPQLDERSFARTVADRIKSRHHEIVVTASDLERELMRLTWANDEPLTHPNSVPMHLIFREAKERQRITVLLSGEGADEMFGGYRRYKASAYRDRLRKIPALSGLIPLAPGVGKLSTLKKVLHRDYPITGSAFATKNEVEQLLAGNAEYLETRRAMWPANRGDSTDALFVYDQLTYLPPLLQRQDRMSMAAGLEARVPFLDHHLAEWANGLDAHTKLASGETKALLKQIAKQWLPSEITHRRKVGFEMPLGTYLRRGGVLSERVQALRDTSSFTSTHLNTKYVERLITEHETRQKDNADLLWTLVAVDSWARVFLGSSLQTVRLPGADTGRDLNSPATPVELVS
jgi:asparagine synthase (glutamine-hydrolysing)